MITIKHNGFKKTKAYLKKMQKFDLYKILEHYGQEGVEALMETTPVYTGLLKSSWYFKIEEDDETIKLMWCNDDIEEDGNVALLIQYGFVTPSGYRVEGRDYINPAIKPVCDKIKKAIEEGVKLNAYN